MNAMILAAGRGERLRPLTDTCPKPLLEVQGKPLIAHHLEKLVEAGIQRVVINVSWLGEQIEKRLGNGADWGLEIVYSREPEALETAGGIVQALPWLDEEFLVINADVYTDIDFSGLRCGEDMAQLVLVPNPDFNPKGDFGLADDRLRNPVEGEDTPYTFAGIAAYRRDFFAGLQPGRRALAPLLRTAADADQIGGLVFRGFWSDVGTPERYRALTDV